ncbi:hypothetical protein THAOC_32938 [Thalassiosira oceanica]|uniref:Uncharacterized protein n=1 Tax=Thalassiosira oceanica TaxID=159749 RepID=K0R861_THAOC|nr:hypothetical protein THAOC_32938 [Thalassiosira oceanica]|eukprot:EJK48284.1 hypothetical protein THAOC_32938 [Thalassiosira oceanica]
MRIHVRRDLVPRRPSRKPLLEAAHLRASPGQDDMAAAKLRSPRGRVVAHEQAHCGRTRRPPLECRRTRIVRPPGSSRKGKNRARPTDGSLQPTPTRTVSSVLPGDHCHGRRPLIASRIRPRRGGRDAAALARLRLSRSSTAPPTTPTPTQLAGERAFSTKSTHSISRPRKPQGLKQKRREDESRGRADGKRSRQSRE